MASYRLDHVTAHPGLGTAGSAAVEDSRHAWLIKGYRATPHLHAFVPRED